MCGSVRRSSEPGNSGGYCRTAVPAPAQGPRGERPRIRSRARNAFFDANNKTSPPSPLPRARGARLCQPREGGGAARSPANFDHGPGRRLAGDPHQIGPPIGQAPRCWLARCPPAVDEYCRPASRCRVGPVPVGGQDQIIKPVTASERLIARGDGPPDHQVISWMRWIIAPEIARPDCLRPRHRTGHAVGAVERTGDRQRSCWRRAVALDLVVADPAAPQRVGNAAAPKTGVPPGHGQPVADHSRCPDFLALVSR